MQNNQFESSRIAEGTMRPGAQHIAPVTGEGVTETAPTDSTPEQTNKPRIRRVLGATSLTGDRVRNSAGDDLGKIEEIMLDLSSGRVAYAVLSSGGFLGIGDKLFLVPWNALQLDQAAHEFVLDVPKQTLENAPGFDKNNWPDVTDPEYGREIYTHYGETPYWEKTN
jgi:sporulation protein YlmC with PRC-barrel domain